MDALAAGAFGTGTARYVQDLKDRPPPVGAEWKTVRVKQGARAAAFAANRLLRKRANGADATEALGTGTGIGADGQEGSATDGCLYREYQQAFTSDGKGQRLCVDCAKPVEDCRYEDP